MTLCLPAGVGVRLGAGGRAALLGSPVCPRRQRALARWSPSVFMPLPFVSPTKEAGHKNPFPHCTHSYTFVPAILG